MRALIAITSAIADQNRIRILCALEERGELCVCQLHELLGLAASTTSRHLGILANAGLVEVRRAGRWSYYRLGQEDVPEEAQRLLAWICQRASSSKIVAQDRERLDGILTYSPEELCQLQAKGVACCSTAPSASRPASQPKSARKRS